MVHVVMVVQVHFFELLFQFLLHHTISRSGMVASTTNDFINMLIIFPVWFNFTQSETILNSIQMVNCQRNSFFNLLTVEVNHFVDDLFAVEVLEDLVLSFFFLGLVFALQAFQVADFFQDRALGPGSVGVK